MFWTKAAAKVLTMTSFPITRFTLTGFLLGLVFVAFAWALNLLHTGIPFTMGSIGAIHAANSVHYVIDTVPLFLAILFSVLGNRYAEASRDHRMSVSENIFNSLLETMADGFITTSDTGSILSFNLAAEKIFGYSEIDIRGSNIVAIIPDATSLPSTGNSQKEGDEGPELRSGMAGTEVLGKKKNERAVPLAVTVTELRIENEARLIYVIRDLADVKKARAKSKQTTDELAQFIDTANAPIFGVDSNGRVNEWNQTATKITGFTKQEVLGKDLVGDFITDEYKAPVKQVLDSALRGNETANYDLPLYTKQGKRVEILLNATTQRDVEGCITGVIGVGQDITEAKIAQAESKQTADELTQLVDTANAPIFGIDSNGLVNEWNQMATKITDFDKGEVLGRDLVADFITDEYKAPVKKVLDDALHGKETANYEFPLYTKAGERVDVLLNAATRRNIDGVITGVIGVGQDITGVKAAQAASRQIDEELTQFIDTANAPIFGIDSKGLVNEWNQTATKITGFTKAEVLGRDLVTDFITDDYKEPVRQVLVNALHGKETANYEFPLYTKDEQFVDVLLNATTRRDVDGNITGVFGVGQDITELRQKERALNQSRKMETVGQLTGGIAHDFNNLLSIIAGNLRFLRQDIGDMNQEMEELFEDAISATNDGAELTSRLLTFSRNRVLKPELKEVNETIETFARFISRTLGSTIDLECQTSEDSLFVHVDTAQLESALLNLAINARDAMPNGGIITIKAEHYSHAISTGRGPNSSVGDMILAPGNYVVVTVSDTGEGIDEHDMPHVYEPFFTTKDFGKGSGLGLSMVYGFMQQSNGQCVVRSKVGEGAAVSMYFPAAVNSSIQTIRPAKSDVVSTGNEVILVVEDEPRVRRVTVRDLRKLGYGTLEAENADIAKSLIASGVAVDLVFTDVLMPGEVDGHMLGAWVEENHPEIKVVLTSGYTKSKVEVKSSGAPFPLIRKPYTVETLSKQLRKSLFDRSGLATKKLAPVTDHIVTGKLKEV